MVYRTMQGKVIDLDKLMRQNELTPAIGNQKVNARGDELGPGGRIVRKREDIIQDYYEGHPESKPTPRVESKKPEIVEKSEIKKVVAPVDNVLATPSPKKAKGEE